MLPADGKVTFIDRMICNWDGPAADHNGVSMVQRQCVEQNSDGIYEMVSENISFSPQNACEHDPTSNHYSPGGFKWLLWDPFEGLAKDYVTAPTASDLLEISTLNNDELKSPALPVEF